MTNRRTYQHKPASAEVLRKSVWLLLMLALGILPLAAQKQSNIWYFGRNAGLDFSGFHAQPLPPGPINSPAGVATYCDSQGHILLSSDGKRIWNSLNMPVNYPDLTGDPNSTQPVTFVPSPWDPNKVYLFTTKRFETTDPDNYGGNFYTIDLSNPAQPAIVNNAEVTGQPGLIKNSSEKFLCIPATFFNPVTGNQDPGYWIIMHEFGNNVFRVFKFLDGVLTDTGPQPVGTPHTNGADDDGSNLGGSGQMKADINGNNIALAVEGGRFFEFFTFNKTTGAIRKRFTLPAGEEDFKGERLHQSYGVEFSPTGNYLYGSARDVAFVYRWDLSEYSQDNAIKFCRFLSENFAAEGGAMQLAPNGKIYVAFNNMDYLGIINSPIRVDCDFQKFGARLVDNETGMGGESTYGLPAPVAGALKIDTISFTKNCSNETITFYINEPGTISSPRSWTFKNLTTGGSLPTRTLSSNECTQINPPAGVYKVQVQFIRNGRQILTDTIEVFDPPQPELYVKDTMPVCRGSIIELDADYGAFYEWDDKSLESRKRKIDVDTLPYLLNEVRVKVTDYHGCVGWDVITLAPTNPPAVEIVTTKATCGDPNGSATVTPTSGDISDCTYLWEHDSTTQNTLTGVGYGMYRVHVWSKIPPFCETIDTAFVADFSAQSVRIQSVDTTICPGSEVTLKIIGEPDEFEWINPPGATGKEIVVNPDTTTYYQLKIISYDGERKCEVTIKDTVFVHPINKPEIGPDQTACDHDTIRINGGADYIGWTWSDGFEGQINPVTADADPLVLFATDINGCTFTDSLKVHFKPLPAIGLGPDRTICTNSPVTLSGDGGGGDAYQWSTGETSEEIAVSRNDQYWLKITKDGCSAYDTVNIRINNPDELVIDSVNVKDITCFGNADGEIRIYASGEGLSWQYSIDNGATFQDSLLFSGLPPHDNYRITVWEDSACRVSRENPLAIREPALLSAGTCVNPPSCETCSDGSITISTIMGGTPPYWVRINGEETGTDMQGLGPGSYTVNITDANGCSWSSDINLLAGMNVRIEASETQPVCPGSPVTLKVVNGGHVEWMNPSGFSADSVSVNPLETTLYQAESTNDLGCSIIVVYTVQVIPHTDPSLGEDVYKCEGDIVTLDAGDGYLGYSWNTGETSRSINLAASKDQVIVTVTDINHCTLSDTVAVYINPYPEVDLGKDKSLCTNTPVGLSGGTGEIYLWNTGASTQSIQVDRSGTYSLVITTLGCSSEDSVEVTIVNPDQLIIDPPLITDNTCFGSESGAIEIIAQGSGGELQYSIDGGMNWQDASLFEYLPAGDEYRIRVREDQLCTGIYPDPVTVGQPDEITPDYRLKSPTCIGCDDGQIIFKNITGGKPPYIISLNGEEKGMTITGLREADYTLVITDSLGCSRSFDIKIDMNNIVPNVITPNGKDANEKWVIPLLKYYPDAVVRIFDMYGKLIRSFDPGYPDPWDGTDEMGRAVAMGTYYYIIDLNEEEENEILKGAVTVLR